MVVAGIPSRGGAYDAENRVNKMGNGTRHYIFGPRAAVLAAVNSSDLGAYALMVTVRVLAELEVPRLKSWWGHHTFLSVVS